MCRLYGFRGSAPSKLDCSLVRAQNALLRQSSKDLRGHSNADGWGIASYSGDGPIVEKCDSAAYEDRRFSEIAGRIVSPTVVAHVRQATVGGRGIENTHPFSRGVWSFAHNGTLTAFARVSEALESEIGTELLSTRCGTTDSELVFLWLLSRMRARGIGVEHICASPESLLEVFAESVQALAVLNDERAPHEAAKLNLLLTDGHTLVASRWGNTLYTLNRVGVHDCQICGLPHVDKRWAKDFKAALVASEPVTQEEWVEVPDRSAVMISREIGIHTEPIAVGAAGEFRS